MSATDIAGVLRRNSIQIECVEFLKEDEIETDSEFRCTTIYE